MEPPAVAVRSRFISQTNHRRNLETFSPTSRRKSNFRPSHNNANNVWTPASLPPTSYRASVSAMLTPQPTDDSGKFHATKRGNNKKEDKKGWIHFVGVGGCGISALALLALKQGYEVSGSDIVWSSYMDALREGGAHLYVGHSELNFGKPSCFSLPDAVVVSSAIPPDNIEIVHAKSAGVPVYKRGDWLGKLTKDFNLIAVTGSHGKSTTTSMIAYVLKAMRDDITAVIGAQVPQFSGENAIHGTSLNFVLEADEYDACFLGLSPHIAVVTNVDWEHVDIFPDEETVRVIFRRFLSKIRSGGHLILCGDSSGAYSLLSNKQGAKISNTSDGVKLGPDSELCSNSYRTTTYGISNFNEWHASSICSNALGGSDYKLCHRGLPVANVSLQVPGVHNVLNSLAVSKSI